MKPTFLFVPIALFHAGCVSGEISAADYIDDGNDSEESIPMPSSDLDEDDDDNASDTASPSQDGPVFYEFSSQDSLLYVQVFKDETAWGSGFAHNHVVRASNWNGSLFFDPNDPSDCEMEFSLTVEDLVVDEDTMREVVGYNDTIASDDRDQIRGHMLASNQLNVTQYPEMTFESNNCDSDPGALSGSLQVTGDLEIIGNAASTNITLDFNLQGGRFYGNGGFQMNHSDFGLEPYSAFAGAVRNAEKLVFSFDMVGSAN